MILIIILLSAYLIGSIPVRFIIGKPRGPKSQIFTQICEFVKGVIPAFLAVNIFSNEFIIALIVLSTLLGSVFPVFSKFKGENTVAVYAGALLVLLEFLFIPLIILWLAFLYISKIVSLSNLSISLIVPFVFLILGSSSTYFLFSLLFSLIIWYTHRDNIKRLMEGNENRINFNRRSSS